MYAKDPFGINTTDIDHVKSLRKFMNYATESELRANSSKYAGKMVNIRNFGNLNMKFLSIATDYVLSKPANIRKDKKGRVNVEETIQKFVELDNLDEIWVVLQPILPLEFIREDNKLSDLEIYVAKMKYAESFMRYIKLVVNNLNAEEKNIEVYEDIDNKLELLMHYEDSDDDENYD